VTFLLQIDQVLLPRLCFLNQYNTNTCINKCNACGNIWIAWGYLYSNTG